MVSVTGLTAARMLAIEAASIVDGTVTGDNLILTRHDGTTINAGNVRGPSVPVPRHYADFARCSANANCNLTPADIAGCSFNVDIAGPSDKYLVTAVADCQTRGATATTALIDLYASGTVQSGRIIWTSPGTPTLRATVTQQWLVTGLATGLRTFKLMATRTGGADNMVTANATHTTLSAVLVDY